MNVRIVNPYFVPTSSIRKALKRAIEPGDVNVDNYDFFRIRYPFHSGCLAL